MQDRDRRSLHVRLAYEYATRHGRCGASGDTLHERSATGIDVTRDPVYIKRGSVRGALLAHASTPAPAVSANPACCG